jgi:hypothetical protein
MKALARLLLSVLLCFVLSPQHILAAGVCDGALVLSTYSSFSTDHLDYRLATLVTENNYDEIKRDAGLNAVIYGVPVGASYSDYQKSVHDKLSSYQSSLSHDQAINILWTGLDAGANGRYKDCLDNQILNGRGLHIAVQFATASDITLLASWNPQGNDPPLIRPKWLYRGDRTTLPGELKQGFTTVIVPRPKLQQTMAINYPGFTGAIILEPLVKLPKLPPVLPMVNTTETYPTAVLASGACADYGQYTSVCSDTKGPDWTIASSHFDIRGDRTACGAYSHCNATQSTPTKVCWQFQTQGHNEECGHSGNTGIQNSQGFLTVTWAHH